jgi:hypothetical protein
VPWGRLRYAGGIFLGAAAVVSLWEFVPHGSTPFLSRLDMRDRVELYKQIATVTASLLGFMIAAVAILVSLDLRRRIVEELQRGESFSLLVINLLAAILFLFLTTTASVAGAIFDDGKAGSDTFEFVYEVLAVTALVELMVGLFFFGVVTYKAATYD